MICPICKINLYRVSSNIWKCPICLLFYIVRRGRVIGKGFIQKIDITEKYNMISPNTKPVEVIYKDEFEKFLRNVNRGAAIKGLSIKYPRTLEEFESLDEETKQAFREAFKLFKHLS